MRRLRRWMFNLSAALLLTLCVAACALWARSYWVMDEVTCRHVDDTWWVRTSTAHLELGEFLTRSWRSQPRAHFEFNYRRDRGNQPYNPFLFLDPEVGDKFTSWERGGFWWYSLSSPIFGNWYVELIVPFWSVAAIAAVIPLARMAAWRRSRVRDRRARAGLCPTCGYDLRATPDRCPECGCSA